MDIEDLAKFEEPRRQSNFAKTEVLALVLLAAIASGLLAWLVAINAIDGGNVLSFAGTAFGSAASIYGAIKVVDIRALRDRNDARRELFSIAANFSHRIQLLSPFFEVCEATPAINQQQILRDIIDVHMERTFFESVVDIPPAAVDRDWRLKEPLAEFRYEVRCLRSALDTPLSENDDDAAERAGEIGYRMRRVQRQADNILHHLCPQPMSAELEAALRRPWWRRLWR
jgi:hypothetical protein